MMTQNFLLPVLSCCFSFFCFVSSLSSLSCNERTHVPHVHVCVVFPTDDPLTLLKTASRHVHPYLNDLPKSHSPLKMLSSTEDTVMLREELSEHTLTLQRKQQMKLT